MMFEKLETTQSQFFQRLRSELVNGLFPQATLFCGSRYTGRMTAALEVARALSCAQEGSDSCSCASCQAFATLESTNLIIISSRDHQSIIETAIGNFQRQRNESSRRFLNRSIRIMLLSYHGALLGQMSQKSQSTFDAAAQTSELLLELNQLDLEGSQASVDKFAKNLKSALKPLFTQSRKNNSISIDQVRAIQEWTAQTAMDGAPRIVIIEAVEQATEGARNSLLKMLEEPPQDVWFILLTENPGRIMQTILSRVRKYYVPPMTREATDRLLQTLFYVRAGQFTSLEAYFLASGGLDGDVVHKNVRMFLDGVLGNAPYSNEELALFASWVDDCGQFAYVFREMTSMLEADYLANRLNANLARSLSRAISESVQQSRVFNQNRKLSVEGLFYHLQELQP